MSIWIIVWRAGSRRAACSLSGVARPQLGSDRPAPRRRLRRRGWRSTTRTVRSPRPPGDRAPGNTPFPLAVVATGASISSGPGAPGWPGRGPVGPRCRPRSPGGPRPRTTWAAASSASSSMLRGRGRQVGIGGVDPRHRRRTDPPLQRAAVVDDRDRPGLPGQGMFEGQLGVLDGLSRAVADHHPLCHSSREWCARPRFRSPRCRSDRERGATASAAVGHLGENDERGAAEQRLHVSLPGVAGDPFALVP